MREYKYPYPVADLIDRLVISQLKAIFIHSHNKEYKQEVENIKHDIDVNIKNKNIKVSADMIHAVIVNALSNFHIWNNESSARDGGKEQDNLLKFTHTLNGVRNTSKNIISHLVGQRKDLKIDCLAAEFLTDESIKKHGDWNIYDKSSN